MLLKPLLFTVGACLSLSDICGANQLENDATLNRSQESNRSEMCAVAMESSEKGEDVYQWHDAIREKFTSKMDSKVMSHGALIDNGGVFLRNDLLSIVDSEFFQDKSTYFFRLKEVSEPISSEEKLAFCIIDMVKDIKCKPKIRLKIGEILHLLNKRDDAVSVLLSLAIDSTVDSNIRLDAANYLNKQDMKKANEACQAYLSIANDPNVEVKIRLKSAEFIERHAKKESCQIYQAIAKDSGVEADSRVEAVKNWLHLEMEDDDGAEMPSDAHQILLQISKSRKASGERREARSLLDFLAK